VKPKGEGPNAQIVHNLFYRFDQVLIKYLRLSIALSVCMTHETKRGMTSAIFGVSTGLC